MNTQEILERARTAPAWTMVDMFNRIDALEKEVEALKQANMPKKRGRPPKVRNGTDNV